jgi:pimeloyl-ACP methyl ester carboxylesterase
MKWERIVYLGLLVFVVGLGVLYFLRFHTGKAIFPVRGEFVQVENTKIYTTVRGEGKTVLFLHGFPYHSESFYSLATRPFPGYRFITIDFPGLGLSEKNGATPVTPDEQALLVKLFLDHIGVSKVDLVGHDLGGGVAIACAANFPRMVHKLVLLAPDSSGGSAAQAMNGLWQIPVVGELWAAVRLDRGFMRDFLERAWSPTSTQWNRLVERYTRVLNTRNGRKGFMELHRGRLGFDYIKHEERMKTETLILWGAQDRVIPVSASDRLLQSLEHSTLEIIPEVGHLPHEEAPEKVYELMKTFLLAPEKKATE